MYAPTKAAVFSGRGRDGWIRTSECRRQRPMPYRLATPPYSFARNSVTLKITRCVRSASQGYMGWVKGLEPSTLGTTIRCSNQLSYTHHIKFAADGNGTPGGIRTPGLLLRRQLLYPAELLAHVNSGNPAHQKVERVMGIEPTCSAWKADILPLNYTRGSLSDACLLYQFTERMSTYFFKFFKKVFSQHFQQDIKRAYGCAIL